MGTVGIVEVCVVREEYDGIDGAGVRGSRPLIGPVRSFFILQ